MKHIRILVLATLLVCLTSTSAMAAETKIEKEHTFTSKDPKATYEAKEQIKANGETYSLKDIEYKVVDTRDLYIKREITYKNLLSKDIPMKRVFTVDGRDITLKAKDAEIVWQEKPKRVAEQYNGYISEPKVPKSVTVVENGKKLKVKLSKLKEEKTTKPFTATAKFTGAKGTDFYLDNSKIEMAEDSPAFTGYEETILQYLGLPASSKITDSKWRGGFVREGGKYVRYAQYTGLRPAADYTAEYDYTLYGAKVVYDNADNKNAKEYTLKAICTYELEEKAVPQAPSIEKKEPEEEGMSLLQKLLFIGAGLLTLALLTVLILYVIGKRKRRQEES